MHISKYSRLLFIMFAAALLVITVSGCKPAQPTLEVLPTAALTEVPLPVATSTPARLVLVDGSGMMPIEVGTYLSETAAANGLAFVTLPSLEGIVIGEETRVVVLLNEPANLGELAASLPGTQFIAAGTFNPSGYTNISIIRSKPDDLAFMAGYLTILSAWDWRAGGFVPAEKSNPFENGARYVCGQCTPYWAPFKYFPLISSAATIEEITNQGTFYVNTFFVDSTLAQPEVLDALIALESVTFRPISLIGAQSTVQPERFAALLGYDLLPGLQALLPQALDGSGGLSASARVVISSISDEGKITPGKQDLFDRVAADLEAGLIEPLSVP